MGYISDMSLHLDVIWDIVASHKILLAISTIIILFLLFEHPDQLIIFLVAISVSIEIGLMMEKFHKTFNNKYGRDDNDRHRDIIITSAVAGAGGIMVASFTRTALNQVEQLFTQLADTLYRGEPCSDL